MAIYNCDSDLKFTHLICLNSYPSTSFWSVQHTPSKSLAFKLHFMHAANGWNDAHNVSDYRLKFGLFFFFYNKIPIQSEITGGHQRVMNTEGAGRCAARCGYSLLQLHAHQRCRIWWYLCFLISLYTMRYAAIDDSSMCFVEVFCLVVLTFVWRKGT